MISPYARQDYVDHNLSDQSSMLNLIEYNWRLPSIAGSADQLLAGAGQSDRPPFDVAGMFDFDGPLNRPLILDPSNGEPARRR